MVSILNNILHKLNDGPFLYHMYIWCGVIILLIIAWPVFRFSPYTYLVFLTYDIYPSILH